MTRAEAGLRLDRVLAAALPELTRSHLKRLVESGLVLLEGAAVKAGYPVREGQEILVDVPPPPAVTPEPERIALRVVHEDDHLLVIDKPAGMPVHPGAGRSRGTLVNALLGRGTPLSGVGAPLRPGIVHRLDKDTSGLLVVAKTDAAHRVLSRDLAARRIARRYWALVWGALTPAAGTISAPIGRSRADRRRMRVVARGGREAVTHYEVLWSGEIVCALELRLETGRTHQIRAHLKHRGHPVFGDPEYGGRSGRAAGLSGDRKRAVKEALGTLRRQALHAAALAFAHPETGERLAFASPLPEDIRSAASALGVPAARYWQSEDA